MIPEEIASLVNAIRQEEYKAQQDRCWAEENGRFFNRPYAAADFEHWSKATYWTIDEAIALAFGKDPKQVNWSTIKFFISVSPFVFKYDRLRDLTSRAVAWQKLYDPIMPVLFLGWAQQNEIEFPEALAEKVRIRCPVKTWKEVAEEFEQQLELTRVENTRQIEDYQNLVASQREIIQRTVTLFDESQARLVALKSGNSDGGKSQSQIERVGMLKLILAMAVEGYKYTPDSGRGTAVKDIISDLEKQGLSLSDDTVRRYLKAAFELLPEWQQTTA